MGGLEGVEGGFMGGDPGLVGGAVAVGKGQASSVTAPLSKPWGENLTVVCTSV